MRLVPSRRLVKRDVSYEFMNRQMVWHAFTVNSVTNLYLLITDQFSSQEFLLFLLPLLSARPIRRRISHLTSRLSKSMSIPSFAQSILGTSTTMGKKEEGGQAVPKRGKYWDLSRDLCAICAENATFSLNLSDPVNAFTSLTSTIMDPSSSAPEKPTSPESDPTSSPPAHPLNTPYVTSCGHVYCYHCLAERMMRAADDGADEGGWECLRCGEGIKDAERWVGDTVEEQENGSEWDGDGFSSISDFESGTDLSASGSLGYSISDAGLSE